MCRGVVVPLPPTADGELEYDIHTTTTVDWIPMTQHFPLVTTVQRQVPVGGGQEVVRMTVDRPVDIRTWTERDTNAQMFYPEEGSTIALGDNDSPSLGPPDAMPGGETQDPTVGPVLQRNEAGQATINRNIMRTTTRVRALAAEPPPPPPPRLNRRQQAAALLSTQAPNGNAGPGPAVVPRVQPGPAPWSGQMQGPGVPGEEAGGPDQVGQPMRYVAEAGWMNQHIRSVLLAGEAMRAGSEEAGGGDIEQAMQVTAGGAALPSIPPAAGYAPRN